VGKPQDAVAGEQEGCIAVTVSFERAPGATKGVAVELHDKPLTGPEGVDLETGGQGVDLGSRQAMNLAEVNEGPFELGADGGSRIGVIGEDPHQGAEASSASASPADVFDRAHVEKVETLRLLEGAGKLGRRDDSAEVEQRSRHRCHRNTRMSRSVAPAQLAGHVHGDSSAAPAGRGAHGHVDAGPDGGPNPP
jgi:hypothetical protein